jgi:hypothetical protein
MPLGSHAWQAWVVSSDDFREPWFLLKPDNAHACEREAAKEIAQGHELHGVGLTALAKCEGCDGVVFRASDDTFAIVRLTWAAKPETRPWPRTTRLGGYIAVELAMDQHAH